jgi:uncharacterized protein (PEP-CTERM system associated)
LEVEQILSDISGRSSSNGLESITRIDPGVRLSSRSGRVQGYLSYNGSYFYRTGRSDSSGGEWQNYLDASALAEVVPTWAFFDARASISQQAISAFGRPAGGNLANDNRTEVSTLWLSPYVTGSLAGLATYEVRVIGSTTDTSAAGTYDSQYGAGLVSLASERERGVGWRLAAKRERVEYDGSQAPTTTDRILGALVFTPDIDLKVFVDAGMEAADLGGPERKEYENYGLGFRWTPSPRTDVAASFQERYFGRGHNVSIQYRSPQSVFSYTDTRDTNDGADPFNLGQPVTLYSLLYQQFAVIQPDPGLREQLVLDYLSLIGRNPNEVVYGGTLVQGIVVERRQFLGWALQGRRNTLTVQAFRTESERIDQAASTVPGADELVAQLGINAALSHRLTPTAALTAVAAYLRTESTPTRAGWHENQVSASVTQQFGPRTYGSLTARYRIYSSSTDPYRETELTARFNVQF